LFLRDGAAFARQRVQAGGYLHLLTCGDVDDGWLQLRGKIRKARRGAAGGEIDLFRDSQSGLRGHGVAIDHSNCAASHQKRGGNCISVTHGYHSSRLFNWANGPENLSFVGVAKLNAN
jgi:hypothetical protein